MRPFGCPVTILNTLDPLGKFNGKVDKGFLVGYSVSSKAFRVFNSGSRIVQDTLHINFLENKPNIAGSGPTWLFDIDTLIKTMNYQPVTAGNQSNPSAEFEDFFDNSIKEINAADSPVPVVGQISTNNTNTFSAVGPSNAVVKLEDITYSDDEEDVDAKADFTNLETTITVSPIPTTRVHKDHPVTQIIETKRVHQALKDPSWIEAMQEEILQFKMQKVWVLVDLPHGKGSIGTKWVFRNKKDERGIVVKNKARLVAQGLTQEEGIDYEEVFASVARIEAIRLFLAYASFMGFMVYQIDVKSSLRDGKPASTPIDTKKPLLKDPDGEDVDVHTYRSMIGSLMYLTSSRPDIMFAVCACARFKVTPKASHLHAVKRIFRYLKGKPHWGLWYPKDSPFNLVAYSDSDYAGHHGMSLVPLWLQLSSAFPKDVPAAGVADEGVASVSVDNVPAAVDEPSIPSPTPPTQPPPPSQDLPSTSRILLWMMYPNGGRGRIIANTDADKDITLKDVADIAKEVDVDAEIEESAYDDEIEPTKLQEVVKVVTTAKLMTEVFTAASATIIAVDTLIPAATITTAPSATRRRKEVVIRDLEDTSTPSTIIHTEPKSKDKGKGIMVHEPKPLKKKTRIEQDEAYARYIKKEATNRSLSQKNMMIYLRNMAGFKMDYFKGMIYNDIRPIFEKKFNSNVAFLEKTKEQMEEEDIKALKRINESQKDKAAKKQKLDKEVKELRKHLQIVPNDDDDVYTEAIPLALKVPVVDYEIHTENNKPYYKIKRADVTHQLYLSFVSMLRNFDREDLEVLWKLIKEGFSSSKPKNFLDDFLLTTLGAMFEKPDVQAQIWSNQRSVHVDLAGREKIFTYKVHSGSNAQQSLELMLLKTSKIYAKGLRLLVKDLLLPSQVDVVG
nr:hypothetical protein [Tanacetum cinerariifolium]